MHTPQPHTIMYRCFSIEVPSWAPPVTVMKDQSNKIWLSTIKSDLKPFGGFSNNVALESRLEQIVKPMLLDQEHFNEHPPPPCAITSIFQFAKRLMFFSKMDPNRLSKLKELEKKFLDPRDVLNTDCLLVSNFLFIFCVLHVLNKALNT